MAKVKPDGEATEGDHSDDPRYRRLLAVTREMAEQGYDAVSMRAVAKQAQMSLTTIYQFVGSKNQLIAEAHAGGMRHFRDGIIARPAEGSTPEARVRALLAEIAASLEQDEVRTRTLMRAIYSGEPDVAAGRQSAAESFRSAIEAAIGDEDGVPERDMIVETLGLVVHGAMLAWLDGRYDGSDVGRLLDNAVTLVFRGRST